MKATRKFDVCGLGNGLVDILAKISQEELARLGLEKGTMRLVDAVEQSDLLIELDNAKVSSSSGGSVANSVIALAQLGGNAAFSVCLGDDRYGQFYQKEFKDFGIHLSNPLMKDEVTGTSLVVITPDAERTMRTSLGISSRMAADKVDVETIQQSDWLFIEGYLFSNSELGHGAIKKAIAAAREAKTKIAITLSEPWVVANWRDAVNEAVTQADLLFANEDEILAFTNCSDTDDAFARARLRLPNVVVTLGPRGVLYSWGDESGKIPAFPCSPVDLTGAGDMFAGSFLYGVTHGFSAAESARAGCFLAKQVISQIGARLHQGTRQFWDESLSK